VNITDFGYLVDALLFSPNYDRGVA
jgi:hypothetical protein